MPPLIALTLHRRSSQLQSTPVATARSEPHPSQHQLEYRSTSVLRLCACLGPQYDNQLLQLFTSSLFIAGLLSSLVASWTTSRWGRRATMLMAGIAFCIGAALTAGAVHLAMLVVGRISLGVGVGFANQARRTPCKKRWPLGSAARCVRLRVDLSLQEVLRNRKGLQQGRLMQLAGVCVLTKAPLASLSLHCSFPSTSRGHSVAVRRGSKEQQ